MSSHTRDSGGVGVVMLRQEYDPMYGDGDEGPLAPNAIYCPECQSYFWEDERRGHYFNGEEIICPAEGDDEEE